MIRRQLLIALGSGLGVLTLCLTVPFPFNSQGKPESLLSAFAHRLSDPAWLENAKKHSAFLLQAFVHPPQPEQVKDDTQAREAASADAMTGIPSATLVPEDQPPAVPGRDLTGLQQALTFYKAGDLAHGDEAAQTAQDDLVRLTLEWAALRTLPHETGLARLQRFAATHPDWPATGWLRHRAEEAFSAGHPDKATVEAFFTASPPQTPLGKLALAQAFAADGRLPDAAKIVRTLWRETDMSSSLETKIRTDYGSYLEKTDYKARADGLLYKEQVGPALRAATLAGPDVLALAKARVAVINEEASDKLMQAVPAPLKADPNYLFAEIQKLRRSDKIKEAVAVMLSAPRDPVRLVNGDEWWVERRLLSRKLLDQGDAKTAYRLCNEHSAQSNELKIEAEFHAGWIALRFLKDPALAAPHFAKAAQIAATPMSIARAAYWQGRTEEAMVPSNTIGRDGFKRLSSLSMNMLTSKSVARDMQIGSCSLHEFDCTETALHRTAAAHPAAAARARSFYEKAAAYPTTYYGQLARQQLGPAASAIPSALVTETPADTPIDAIRVVELLLAVGEKDLATSLAVETVQHLKDQSQIAALAAVLGKQQDAHLSLMIGKLAVQRGIALDDLAYPTYGIPAFEPLQNSADKAVVYSIARQESAFDPKALSRAGAMGLMQMIASTAKRTAERAGLAFDEGRLMSDATFNAQLGAAHLGTLIAEQRGSLLLTFAAYNAGGKRVKQWIDAYGDPRSPDVDPIDWIERIPFTETRNYVQRVLENVAIYQTQFGKTTIVADPAAEPKPEAKL